MDSSRNNVSETQPSAPWSTVSYAKKASKKPDPPVKQQITKKRATLCPHPNIETFSIPPLYFLNSECPPKTTHLDICQASIRMLGFNGVTAAQKFGTLWHLYPSSLENRAKLAGNLMSINGYTFSLHSKNPSVLVNEYGQELPATKLTINGIPLSVPNEEVMEALLGVGVKPRSPLGYDQVLLKEGLFTAWYSGQRSLFIDIPSPPLADIINISSFICQLECMDNGARRHSRAPSQDMSLEAQQGAMQQQQLATRQLHKKHPEVPTPIENIGDQPAQGKPNTSLPIPLNLGNLANNQFHLLSEINNGHKDGEPPIETISTFTHRANMAKNPFHQLSKENMDCEEGELPLETDSPPDIEIPECVVNMSNPNHPLHYLVIFSYFIEREEGEIPELTWIGSNTGRVLDLERFDESSAKIISDIVDDLSKPFVSNDVAPDKVLADIQAQKPTTTEVGLNELLNYDTHGSNGKSPPSTSSPDPINFLEVTTNPSAYNQVAPDLELDDSHSPSSPAPNKGVEDTITILNVSNLVAPDVEHDDPPPRSPQPPIKVLRILSQFPT